jgi:long-chain acyl-CoA synthetase
VTGGRLVEGYGLTESSPVALANPLNDNARPGTIGIPMPSTDVRIADLDIPSQNVGYGVPGELCLRGPQIFQGYWNQAEETAEMLHDGWLHTGDIAIMDADGFVTIVDRKRDVILASGFSIFPSEIEDVLNEHPAVEKCAVTGVPHFYRGETVKAFVIPREGEHVTEEELREYCSARLVAYKVPSQFEFRTTLPMNMLGKVLRRVLRAEHEAIRSGLTGPQPRIADDPDSDAYGAWRQEDAADPITATIDMSGVDLREDLPDPHIAEDLHHTTEFQRPVDALDPAWKPSTNGHTPEAATQEINSGVNLVDELERLVRLRDAGALTQSEFDAAKSRLLQ